MGTLVGVETEMMIDVRSGVSLRDESGAIDGSDESCHRVVSLPASRHLMGLGSDFAGKSVAGSGSQLLH